MREALTRVLRSCRIARGDAADGFPSRPSTTLQRTDCDFDAGAWDRHGHLALAAAGIGRVVLNRLPAIDASLLPLAETAEPPWRAVIGVPGETGRATLAALHEFGVRGVRFDLGAAPADGLDPLLRLADRIVPFGWHIEIRLAAAGAGRALSKAEWLVMQLPLAVCFSGIGRFASAQGPADLGFGHAGGWPPRNSRRKRPRHAGEAPAAPGRSRTGAGGQSSPALWIRRRRQTQITQAHSHTQCRSRMLGVVPRRRGPIRRDASDANGISCLPILQAMLGGYGSLLSQGRLRGSGKSTNTISSCFGALVLANE